MPPEGDRSGDSDGPSCVNAAPPTSGGFSGGIVCLIIIIFWPDLQKGTLGTDVRMLNNMSFFFLNHRHLNRMIKFSVFYEKCFFYFFLLIIIIRRRRKRIRKE